ncbi:hypothetical protein SBOR_2002 [Sclerotinia borealis F-4128]|uniref:Mis12 domain-containing protein n=1 Tax=Sclerotinia borealis (strain F-4128) TaxID=1432307 RepID=W9CP14_SCLBF|nr:hypothetical protein SBOR_2002 [Sclerotinia borealis F-4128]
MSAADTALLTEHLTYRPIAVIDDIINSINLLAFRAIDALEKGLLAAPPASIGFTPTSALSADDVAAQCQHEIEYGVYKLETLLNAKIDKNFDKMEIYLLRNVFAVPADVRDWIRLSHYEGLDFRAVEENGAGANGAPTLETVTLQRKRLRETMKLNAVLRAEKERNEKTIAALKGVISSTPSPAKKIVKAEDGTEMEIDAEDDGRASLAFLQKKGDLTKDGKHPIATTTEFALTQLPALRQLLDNLGPRLKELSEGNGMDGMVGEQEKSWRRERLEFIEKETRRHFENVRGLELGSQGEVRDGEWQGEGRKLGNGEVEDLERVVRMVESHAAPPADGDAMDEGT